MASTYLEQDTVAFKSEGRLLQELGLRLVASPEVALVELIKNAYDADSPDCEVRIGDDGETLLVSDHGSGMTRDDFLNKWMQIATSSKLGSQLSPRFKRPLTGAKGIGRFAVRFLGDQLTLTTTAKDRSRGFLTTLSADFNWPKIDKQLDLAKTEVTYRLTRAAEGATTGTTLTIRKLRSAAEFVQSRDLRAEVLKIVAPIGGLESGHLQGRSSSDASDPGFNVILPGRESAEDTNLAALVLENYWARLTVSLKGNSLTFQVKFPTHKKPKELRIRVKTDIKSGCFADIRYFPRRAGVFRAKEVNGREAWAWVRSNSGVAVVDHGFRIKPYGFTDDDWLLLDVDAAHNTRDWRTDLARAHFPISPEIAGRPGENPALNLSHNAQIVGAVFIESARKAKSDEDHDLVPAMDREGLLENRGFAQLKEYVRAGLEYLALCDKQELERVAAKKARDAAASARRDVQKAIENIQSSATLAPSDRNRIVKQYRELADRLEEQEEYAEKARRSLITMSLLGVVAGFLTHESDAMLHELEDATRKVAALARKDPSLRKAAKELEARLDTVRGYLTYSKFFIRKVGTESVEDFSAAGQVRHVIRKRPPQPRLTPLLAYRDGIPERSAGGSDGAEQ